MGIRAATLPAARAVRAWWAALEAKLARPLARWAVPRAGGQVLAPAGEGDDEAFVARAYAEVLGRAPDPDGAAAQLRALAAGATRTDVLLALVRSHESTTRLVAAATAAHDLPDLRAERPDRYRAWPDHPGRTTFVAADDEDLRWLEGRIHAVGYYDRPGVWDGDVSDDKQRMADVVAGVAEAFDGCRVLELGCYTGALLVAMADRGLDVAGVELSAAAAAVAPPSIRHRVVVGDAVDPPVDGPFDVVVGLDVFEHVAPSRLAAGLQRLAGLVAPGGAVVANIPAFGRDDVFGEVFPRYLPSWEADETAGRWYHELDCDPLGYPRNGHLVWAGTRWWEQAFAAVGLVRDREAERAAQARHGTWWAAHTPARRSLYVFRRAG